MYSKVIPISLFAILGVFQGCRFSKETAAKGSLFVPNNSVFPAPHLIVYKTKKNYSQFVPVILNAEKNTLVSYPSPADMQLEGKPILPILLRQKYWMDVKGINKNVAYLSIKIEDFIKLDSVPSTAYLMGKILEKDPLLEMCDCGIKENDGPNVEMNLNRLILDKKLKSTCVAIK